jgi:hypothetical protein
LGGFYAARVAVENSWLMPFAIRADRLVRGPVSKVMEATAGSRRAESLREEDCVLSRAGSREFGHKRSANSGRSKE